MAIYTQEYNKCEMDEHEYRMVIYGLVEEVENALSDLKLTREYLINLVE